MSASSLGTPSVATPSVGSAAPDPADIRAQIARLERELKELRATVEQPQKAKKPKEQPSQKPLAWRRWMPRFLKVLRKSGNASAAIRAVVPSRATVYRHRARCVAFHEAWEAALRELAQERPSP